MPLSLPLTDPPKENSFQNDAYNKEIGSGRPAFPIPPPEPFETDIYSSPSYPRVAINTPPSTVVKEAYEINYCDGREFSAEHLAEYGLERVEYFVYNKSCSKIFFQCAIGQSFLLKCPSDDQAFDPATVNCNFRHSIKLCPEYDHVMHCSRWLLRRK